MSLTDAEREKYSQLYREFDADNNGLQFPELARLLRKIGWTEDRYTDADLADKFLEADQDDSRVINEEELLTLLNQKPREELNASNIRRTFKEIDQDGSGKVNVEEFRAALANGGCQATLDEIQAIIDEGDTSGDGMLDCNELLKACGF